MKNTLVSVIIPVYNRKSCVKDAIESVFAQTHKNIEIIVVDDGSDVDYFEYLKPYLDRIFLISLSENRGVSAARNEGIKAAKGDYIAFLDSDDLWLPYKIKEQLKLMQKEGTKVCHTDEFWFKKDRFINQNKKCKRYGGWIFDKILDICRISPSSLICHREIFENSGFFDENMRVCEDYEIYLRIAPFFQISYLVRKCIIKRSFTGDQLSIGIEFIESVRLGALERFIKNSENLPESCRKSAYTELERKRKIVKIKH